MIFHWGLKVNENGIKLNAKFSSIIGNQGLNLAMTKYWISSLNASPISSFLPVLYKESLLLSSCQSNGC